MNKKIEYQKNKEIYWSKQIDGVEKKPQLMKKQQN